MANDKKIKVTFFRIVYCLLSFLKKEKSQLLTMQIYNSKDLKIT